MSLKLTELVNNIFHTDKKQEEQVKQQQSALTQTANKVFGSAQQNTFTKHNPFLNKNGKLFNPGLNYQGLLNNPNISQTAKKYITQATGLTEIKKPTDTSDYQSFTDNSNVNTYSNNPVGFVSAKYESGGNGGTISQDTGGLSYGVHQFNTGSGSADNFVNWLKQTNPQMASAFGNYKAGTTEFSNAWTQTFSKYGEDFTNTQRQYTYDKFAVPLIELAKQKTGVDFSRSPALKELVFSTAVQFGSGSLGLSALGNITADMTDTQIINASYDKKINNYKSYFQSSTPAVQEGVRNRFINERNDVLALVNSNTNTNTTNNNKNRTQSDYASYVGKRITDTSKYNNGAAKGQCVWYVLGRASERNGKNISISGNANEVWYNAKPESKLSATTANIKPNSLISFAKGTSNAGQSYGHVIFVEDVVGDTVYYTEGGSGYYKNGTDGVVKTASKQGILSGVNSNGTRFGSNAVGIIDLSKY